MRSFVFPMVGSRCLVLPLVAFTITLLHGCGGGGGISPVTGQSLNSAKAAHVRPRDGLLDKSWGVDGLAVSSPVGAIRKVISRGAGAGHFILGDRAIQALDGKGQPDVSYGPAGNGVIAFTPPSSLPFGEFTSMALQPDGKLVAAGFAAPNCDVPPYQYYVIRLTADGRRDTSFGNAGEVLGQFSVPAEKGRLPSVRPQDGFAPSHQRVVVNQPLPRVVDEIQALYNRPTFVRLMPEGEIAVGMSVKARLEPNEMERPLRAGILYLRPDGSPSGAFGGKSDVLLSGFSADRSLHVYDLLAGQSNEWIVLGTEGDTTGKQNPVGINFIASVQADNGGLIRQGRFGLEGMLLLAQPPRNPAPGNFNARPATLMLDIQGNFWATLPDQNIWKISSGIPAQVSKDLDRSLMEKWAAALDGHTPPLTLALGPDEKPVVEFTHGRISRLKGDGSEDSGSFDNERKFQDPSREDVTPAFTLSEPGVLLSFGMNILTRNVEVSRRHNLYMCDRANAPVENFMLFPAQGTPQWVERSMAYLSEKYVVSGLENPSPVWVWNGEWSLNGGRFRDGGGLVKNGDEVVLRVRSSDQSQVRSTATMVIGCSNLERVAKLEVITK